MASNTGILPQISNIICIIVSPKYIRYKSLAVVFSLGTSFPKLGPGLSALIRFTLEPPLSGTTASRNTRTPIPPIQWVKLRQNIDVWDNDSTSSSMVAPVVVNPDIVSKRALVNDGISFVSTNGIHPKILSIIQLSAVETHPSFK